MSRSFYIGDQENLEYIQACDRIASAKFFYDNKFDISLLYGKSDFLIASIELIFNYECEITLNDEEFDFEADIVSVDKSIKKDMIEYADYQFLFDITFTSKKWLEKSEEEMKQCMTVFNFLNDHYFEQHLFAYKNDDKFSVVGCNMEYAMIYHYLVSIYNQRESIIDA